MRRLNNYFLLFIFLFSLSTCISRPKPLWVEPICYSTSQQIDTMKTLFIKGKMKVSGFGYGFSGTLYLIATTPSLPTSSAAKWTGKLRADIINPLGPLLSLTIAEDRFALLFYPKGEVYLGNTEKVPINLRNWIYLLGQQMWPIYTEHVVYADNKKDTYYIKSLNYPTLEELWLRRDTLKIKKIRIKDQEKNRIFKAQFAYKNGEPELLKIHISGIKIELAYLKINQNIELKASLFKLEYPEEVKKRDID